MAGQPKSVMRMEVHYYDENRSPDLVICGQFEYLQAQRKYNGKTLAQAGKESDLEYMGYVAYLAAKRMKLVDPGVTYEQWAEGVMALESEDDGKDAEGTAAEGAAPESTEDGSTPGESPAPPVE